MGVINHLHMHNLVISFFLCPISLLKLCMAQYNFMHVQVSESYEFVSYFIRLCSRGGGGGRIFTRGGDIFLGNPLWGGEVVLRIFSPPEKISGGRFCPVTPVNF